MDAVSRLNLPVLGLEPGHVELALVALGPGGAEDVAPVEEPALVGQDGDRAGDDVDLVLAGQAGEELAVVGELSRQIANLLRHGRRMSPSVSSWRVKYSGNTTS